MKKDKKYERINFLIPHQTAEKLRASIPAGQRSRFVNDAVEEKLASQKKDWYKELLRVRKTGPKVSWDEVVQWVREDRESH